MPAWEGALSCLQLESRRYEELRPHRLQTQGTDSPVQIPTGSLNSLLFLHCALPSDSPTVLPEVVLDISRKWFRDISLSFRSSLGTVCVGHPLRSASRPRFLVSSLSPIAFPTPPTRGSQHLAGISPAKGAALPGGDLLLKEGEESSEEWFTLGREKPLWPHLWPSLS